MYTYTYIYIFTYIHILISDIHLIMKGYININKGIFIECLYPFIFL